MLTGVRSVNRSTDRITSKIYLQCLRLEIFERTDLDLLGLEAGLSVRLKLIEVA